MSENSGIFNIFKQKDSFLTRPSDNDEEKSFEEELEQSGQYSGNKL